MEPANLECAQMVYAIIEYGGKQHWVEPGMAIRTEKIPAEEGSEVIFDRVLMVKTEEGEILLATAEESVPYQVVGELVRQIRGEKIVVFKKRRKETYKKKQGHRQALSLVRIEAIRPLQGGASG